MQRIDIWLRIWTSQGNTINSQWAADLWGETFLLNIALAAPNKVTTTTNIVAKSTQSKTRALPTATRWQMTANTWINLKCLSFQMSIARSPAPRGTTTRFLDFRIKAIPLVASAHAKKLAGTIINRDHRSWTRRKEWLKASTTSSRNWLTRSLLLMSIRPSILLRPYRPKRCSRSRPQRQSLRYYQTWQEVGWTQDIKHPWLRRSHQAQELHQLKFLPLLLELEETYHSLFPIKRAVKSLAASTETGGNQDPELRQNKFRLPKWSKCFYWSKILSIIRTCK